MNAKALRPLRVGMTQSNRSTPRETANRMSSGVPTAKLAQAVGLDFGRLQFTPDLMPSDIVGTTIFNYEKNDFTVKKGPVFTNLLLADEINRSPAKTQAALLEVMQEKQVTIGETSFPLEQPFLVLATSDKDGNMDLPYSYHCGSDPVYRVFTFNQHIHVEDGHPELNIEFDIRKLLVIFFWNL